MTIKRAVLSVVTVIVLFVISVSLVSSWNQPQVTGQLQLYQSNLLLQATEWQSEDFSAADLQRLRQALLGATPLKTVIKEYQQVQTEAAQSLQRAQTMFEAVTPKPVLESEPDARRPHQARTQARTQELKTVVQQQQALIDQLTLRLGLLEVQQAQTDRALDHWQQLVENPATASELSATAAVLQGLWQASPRLLPESETILTGNLDGWFRFRALEQLYQVQNRPEAVVRLVQQEQVAAQATLLKLIAIGFLPTVGSFLGIGLLIFLAVQWLTQGKGAIMAAHAGKEWQVPWGVETILQVLVIGFFFVGQIVVPQLLSLSGLNFAGGGTRLRAIYAIAYYLLMASGGIAVLIASIWSFRPLPEGWFRFKWWGNWLLWGWGGYLAALPLMIGVSLLNQRLWQGQGGSNPLLQTVLEEQDPVALLIFFVTAAVAAPLFEEVLFRGFLLPSLTRYMPVWGAIGLSSFIFAAAHLSLSEILPLTVLGTVLGFIYSRSRNLLAPMLLHSTWNSVTMIGLFLLGTR